MGGVVRFATVEATRTSVAILLLMAAYLKATSLRDISESLFLIVGLCCEAATALWLLSGIYSRLCWFWTGLLFSLFASVAIVKIASGAPTCNCFGEFSPTPTHMLILDLVVLGIVVTHLWWFSANQAARYIVTGTSVIRWGLCVFVVLFAAHNSARRFENLLLGVAPPDFGVDRQGISPAAKSRCRGGHSIWFVDGSHLSSRVSRVRS